MEFLKILTILGRQKKRIIVLIFILLVFLAYFFSLNYRRRIIKDTLYWEKRTSLAKSLLSELKSEQAVIAFLKNQAQTPRRLMLLPQNQDLLQAVRRSLQDYAQRMNVRIVSIKPDSGQPVNNDTFILNAQVIKTFTVEIEAGAGYMNLARYFDTLYRVAPAILSVERLKISKPKTGQDRLKVIMELRFYSL